MIIWLYRLAFVPVFVCLFPFYLPKIIRRGGYLEKIKQRFGHYPRIDRVQDYKRIWMQVVSVGEAQAALSVIDKLLDQGQCQLFVTTTTTSAYAFLQKRLQNHASVWVGFFPFDFVLFSRRAWRRVCPDLVLLFESELWPEHLYQASVHQVPVWLLNARFSDRTYQRYLRFPYLARWLYGFLDKVMFVSQKQMQQLLQLGLDSKKLMRMGQLKFDVKIDMLTHQKIQRLIKGMGFICVGEGTRYLLGSSTWNGEEEILLDALKCLRSSGMDVRLILVPRHVERGEDLLKLVKRYGFSWSRRSDHSCSDEDVIVHIADTIGEIQQLSQCADLALVGKSFFPHEGGQTPLELACCGVPMLYGPGMSNFREVCDDLESRLLSRLCGDRDEAIQTIIALLEKSDDLGSERCRLQAWSQENRGALSFAMGQLSEFFAEDIV
ncbi:MAG: glycosyltransferase N-terminal domain-containing protein [Pseudomonadota bacterium]|nr:glycosyltransferase N-terminal domain-containing protein [Pseudomonadota bacterium]